MAILPVIGMGNPVLHRKAKKVKTIDDSIQKLIDNMIETMHHSKGVGLAAPQVGLSIRLSVADGAPFAEEEEGLKDFTVRRRSG